MKTYREIEDAYIGHSREEDSCLRDSILRNAFKDGWSAAMSEMLRWRHPQESPGEDMGVLCRFTMHGLDGHIIVVGDYRDDRFIFSQEVSPALQFTGWRPLWG